MIILIIITLLLSISAVLGYVVVGRRKPHSFYVNPDGKPVKLLHSNDAVNPTFEQLITFLKADQTEKLRYIPGQFVCSNFAETLQHNATRSGYRCGWVVIDFKDGSPSHSCNVFHTTDKGLIFVDCTNSPNSKPGEGYDTIVDLYPRKTYQSHTVETETNHIPMGEVLGYRIFW